MGISTVRAKTTGNIKNLGMRGFVLEKGEKANGILLDAQMHEAVAAIAATGVSPIVRIAANEGWMVKRMIYPETGFPELCG
jgi:hypothetical protein